MQALILSPTRELAAQTEKVILAIGDFMNVQAHACIGGKSIGEDIRKLEHGVQVVSGTPGRVYDMIKRRTLRTRAIKLLILVRNLCFSYQSCSTMSQEFKLDVLRKTLYVKKPYEDFTHGITVAVDL